MPADAASPCVNVCVIDDATGWCAGCGRTIEEIVGWGTADVTMRRTIRAQLPERMAVLTTKQSSPGLDAE
ncbi:DUF1289 domain-containing protein [uncultured Sphingomonas sp.]|uniref:DUF1289 domain-containing protein n=1 Tax=uncultured Sphingomonas sp. TaxID=158754 RepID=UPI0035CACDF0